jgi:hypothetical protein
MELFIRNGMAIPTKRIAGYVENATRIFCITKPSLPLMFAGVFVKKELQIEFVINMVARHQLKKAGLHRTTTTTGIDIQQ